jgi:nucleophosmin 1
VYFTGYQVQSHAGVSEDEESESEEELLPQVTGNGKSEASEAKPAAVAKKPDSTASKQRVNFVEPKKDVKAKAAQSDESDDSDEEDSDEEDDSSDDEIPQKLAAKGDSEDSDGDSDEDEDTTPKAADPGPSKKRSTTKTPVSNKKAKLVTPPKTDGKKASGHVHIATPYPNKGKEAKQQAQKSGGSFSCKSCSKLFGSQMGVDSHTKDKHGPSA